jgi:integrase
VTERAAQHLSPVCDGVEWDSPFPDREAPAPQNDGRHLFCWADRLRPQGAVEGKLKTDDSRDAIPIPEDIQPTIEAWRQVCADTSPEALMFPTEGRNGGRVPRQARNFLKWRILPIADKLGIPRKLLTFQVMRRTLGTDLQQHGTMKDAQRILRHASIRTTANIYMQPIPASVAAAINSRTRAILGIREQKTAKVPHTTVPNGSKFGDADSASG